MNNYFIIISISVAILFCFFLLSILLRVKVCGVSLNVIKPLYCFTSWKHIFFISFTKWLNTIMLLYTHKYYLHIQYEIRMTKHVTVISNKTIFFIQSIRLEGKNDLTVQPTKARKVDYARSKLTVGCL